MNSTIGGTDVVFEAARQGFDIALILDALSDVWPDGFFQDAEEEDVRPLTGDFADLRPADAHEFFVYKDRASADSWAEDGWTEEHGNDMAHVLVADNAPRPEYLQLTLVIGATTSESSRLIAAVSSAFDAMAEGGPAPRRSRRVNWDADLRAAGFTAGKQQFYETVDRLRTVMYSDWTTDELACHPSEALQFCEAVRRDVAPVPDYVVMKALMNRRRQPKR